MNLSAFLDQKLSENTVNHLAELRKELLEKGLISKFEQKYLYTPAQKFAALEWYKHDLQRQDTLGSSGSKGKLFEAETRILWSIAQNIPLPVDMIKSLSCKYNDMRVKVDGKFYVVELKTGCGALAYGADRAECLQNLQKLLKKKNVLFVWKYKDDEPPLCYELHDLLTALERYNGDFSTWVVWKDSTKAGRTQLNFQTYTTSKAKLAYLDSLQFDSYDWETIRDMATFGDE